MSDSEFMAYFLENFSENKPTTQKSSKPIPIPGAKPRQKPKIERRDSTLDEDSITTSDDEEDDLPFPFKISPK